MRTEADCLDGLVQLLRDRSTASAEGAPKFVWIHLRKSWLRVFRSVGTRMLAQNFSSRGERDGLARAGAHVDRQQAHNTDCFPAIHTPGAFRCDRLEHFRGEFTPYPFIAEAESLNTEPSLPYRD